MARKYKPSHPDQLHLPGMEPPEWRDALFFALFPDDSTAQQIAALALEERSRHGLHGTPLVTARFHVTLHFLGEYAGLPGATVARAISAGNRMAAAPFALAFDQVLSFRGRPGNRPCVLCGGGDTAQALQVFRRQLGEALVQAGFDTPEADYEPHVTLLYDGEGVARHAVDAIGWTAGEFVLVHSLRGRNQYVPLARWPLQ
ncbi:MAG: 2'-5' RNA ligase family protein [Pseudomonadota bacterium]